MKHVSFIRGRYVVRVTVPAELRDIVGKRELVQPLGGDKKAAERNAHGVIARFHSQIDEARERLAAAQPTISIAAKSHYSAELEADVIERRTDEATVVALRKLTQPRRASLLRLVAAGQITGEEAEALIGYAADALHAKGVAPAIPRAELLKTLAEVQLEAMTQFEARDKGMMIAPEPKLALLTEPDPEPVTPAPATAGKGATLSEVLTAFHRERTAGGRTLAEKTMAEHNVAVRMFDEFMGSSIPVRSITRANMLAYKQALLETPNRYTLRFPGLTLPQAIKANAERKEPFATLDPQTINMKWLSHISTIFKWAANNGFIEVSPAHGVRVDTGSGYKEPSRVPFSHDDLKAIFGSPLYLETPRTKWATKEWALLLALYTGARSSSEIARIKISDIYDEQGIWVIHLSEASKNVRSKRIVPIHSALIDLGFMTHIEKLRHQGEKRLFPDWKPEDVINRWFLRTYKAEVGIEDSRKVFHSFRHTLKTALARHGVNRDVSDLITGHKDQSVGGIYIGDQAVTMVQAMRDGLNRVTFDLPIHKQK